MPGKKPKKSTAPAEKTRRIPAVVEGSAKGAVTPEVLGPEEPGRAKPRKGTPRERSDFDEAEEFETESSDASPEDAEFDDPEKLDDDDDEDTTPASESERLPAAPASIDPEIRAISPTDPLRRYLEEVRKHPLLDPEEECDLAMKLRNEGDVEAAKRLVQANLRLVVKIAFEYRSVYANVMDLIQEGNIGLMKAVSKYEPAKGARLGYYSSWWIRSYILKYLLDNFRLVRVGTTQAQKKLFFHLMREKERLEAQGLIAAPKLLAQKFDVREKDVVEMEQRLSSAGGEVSIDAPMRPGESKASFGELLPDSQEQADDRLAREQLLKLLSHRLPEFEKTLNEKEKRLLKERLTAEEPKTLQEVANLYGLTRERARQIEAKVITKLRDFLTPQLTGRAADSR